METWPWSFQAFTVTAGHFLAPIYSPSLSPQPSSDSIKSSKLSTETSVLTCSGNDVGQKCVRSRDPETCCQFVSNGIQLSRERYLSALVSGEITSTFTSHGRPKSGSNVICRQHQQRRLQRWDFFVVPLSCRPLSAKNNYSSLGLLFGALLSILQCLNTHRNFSLQTVLASLFSSRI